MKKKTLEKRKKRLNDVKLGENDTRKANYRQSLLDIYRLWDSIKMMRRGYMSKKTIGLALTVVGKYCAHIEDAIFTYKLPATSFSSIVG